MATTTDELSYRCYQMTYAMRRHEQARLDEAAVDLQRETEQAGAVEVMVETNAGTYCAAEACRKVGTGDPQFADRTVYERADGRRRATGPEPDDAPGYMRRINADQLAAARREYRRLRDATRAADKLAARWHALTRQYS